MSQKEETKHILGKGKLFEQQLFMLILIKGQQQVFDIGKEIKYADKFDDLAIRYNQNPRKHIFLQAKYVDDAQEKKLTEAALLGEEQISLSKEDFNLSKYFSSYRKIMKSFREKEGEQLEKLIIFTNASGISNIRGAQEVDENEGIISVLETNKEAKVYKFNTDELSTTIMNKLIEKEISDNLNIKELAKEFVGYIKNGNINLKHFNEFLIDYKRKLIQENIIYITEEKFENRKRTIVKFHEDFIQEKSESAAKLKEELINKVNEMQLQLTKEDIEAKIWEMNHNFEVSEDKNENIKRFFSYLELRVNQPSGDDLFELITAEEIKRRFIKDSSADPMYVVDYIGKYVDDWKFGGNKQEEKWILSNEKQDFEKNLIEFCSRPEAALRTAQYMHIVNKKIERLDVKWKEPVPGLENFLQNKGKYIFRINTKNNSLTATKLIPVLDHPQNIILSLKRLLEEDLGLEGAFKLDEYNLLLIDCDCDTADEKKQTELFERLSNIRKENENKGVALVTSENNELTEELLKTLNFPLQVENDTAIYATDLKECTQHNIRELEILFQAKNVQMKDLLDNVIEIMDIEILADVINGEDIIIGQPLKSLGEVKDYYINRILRRKILFRPDIIADIKSGRLSDYFVISGSDYCGLSTGRNIFVFQDDRRAHVKFKNLVIQYPHSNIHWLRYDRSPEKESLIWQKTSGSISSLVTYKIEDKRRAFFY